MQTFFISDSNARQQDSPTKPARACDACYDTVFPVIRPPSGEVSTNLNNESHKSDDTIPSLSHLPSWLSMPSLPVQRQPHALMAIDTSCSRDISLDNIDDVGSEMEERERKGRVRVKSHQRVRGYQQLLEDFQEQSHAVRHRLSSKASQSQMTKKAVGMDDTFEMEEDEDAEGGRREGEEEQDHVDPSYMPTQPIASSPVSSRRKELRREDTARRSKRFSLPAIGLQTTAVTARTSIESEEEVVVVPVSKRYSLVLAGRNSSHQVGKGQHEHGGQVKGLAAARLSELLSGT